MYIDFSQTINKISKKIKRYKKRKILTPKTNKIKITFAPEFYFAILASLFHIL